ncbi:MAG TPA: GTPase [Gaiellaceae bacterium]|nr:GTPase [Gaiellaceae bacterium]
MTADLDERLAGLARAVELADGRLEEEPVEAARAVVARAGRRLGLDLDATVVALAGPTGAGKSSLFNALAGGELAAVSRLRPTTGAAEAAMWGERGDDLLDWLDVRRRHRLAGGDLDGLVLVDLPDFDSVELAHRLEVDRLVELVDLVLWVVDPQKYADAAWHDRYLRAYAGHEEAMAVVLNQADVLPAEALAACLADLGRLLGEELAGAVPVLAASARTGEGLPALRRLLADRVAARNAALLRLAADTRAAAAGLAGTSGDPDAGGVRADDRERVLEALADAAGVPVVARAVAAAHRRRGSLAAGWPFLRWIGRIKRDPLRRLRLPETPQEAVRTSLPGPSAAQLARVETEARRLADRAVEGLPDPWPRLARAAANSGADRLPDRLDRAVAGADLHVTRPRWWRLAGFVQRLLAGAVVVGLLWLLALAVAGYLRLDDVVPVPEVEGVEVPTALVLVGGAAGLLLALVARAANRIGAGRRARAASRAVRTRVAEVADELVVEPVEHELAAHRELALALATAVGEAPRRGIRGRLRPRAGPPARSPAALG